MLLPAAPKAIGLDRSRQSSRCNVTALHMCLYSVTPLHLDCFMHSSRKSWTLLVHPIPPAVQPYEHSGKLSKTLGYCFVKFDKYIGCTSRPTSSSFHCEMRDKVANDPSEWHTGEVLLELKGAGVSSSALTVLEVFPITIQQWIKEIALVSFGI